MSLTRYTLGVLLPQTPVNLTLGCVPGRGLVSVYHCNFTLDISGLQYLKGTCSPKQLRVFVVSFGMVHLLYYVLIHCVLIGC